MRNTLFSGGALLALASITVAHGDSTPNAELQAQVARLEAEVARLTGDHWLTDQRSNEIRLLVEDVLADADTRASLLQSGAVAGFDKHPFLASADGNFRLELQGQMQVRFVYANRDNSNDDDNRWGFENRRTKLKFAGHIINPDWYYKITGAFSRSSGRFALEDAYIGRKLGDGWKLQIGQFKGPWLREELVSSSAQLAVERSLVNEEYNQGFQQGIQLAYRGDRFGFTAMVHDGLRASNTAWNTEDVEFAAGARAEFLAAGDWNRFKDFTSFRGSEFAALIGAAVTWEIDEYGTVSGPEEERWGVTLDAGLEFDGANLFGAFVYFSRDDAVSDAADQWAFVVQGGVFFSDDWEGFLRYEYGDYDTTGVEDLSLLTIGVNRYWARHGLKWTTDLGFGINEVASPWSTTGAGWQADALDQDGQIVFRTQMQLLF
ncbi:MAG: porin [Planctomycetota bacterium]|nr:porin [Planctomycetota bacterium]